MTTTETASSPSRNFWTPTKIALFFFVFFDSLVLYGTYLNQRGQYAPIELASPAPNFAWADFNGKTHTLKELAGHTVVLHFWATWCPPCRDELPRLIKAASENKDIYFLTVSSDDALEKPRKFVKDTADLSGLTLPKNLLTAWDPAKVLTYEQFQTDRYPESIIIGPDQRLRRKYPAPVDWYNPAVRTYLKEIREDK